MSPVVVVGTSSGSAPVSVVQAARPSDIANGNDRAATAVLDLRVSIRAGPPRRILRPVQCQQHRVPLPGPLYWGAPRRSVPVRARLGDATLEDPPVERRPLEHRWSTPDRERLTARGRS
jgi:hypothetical protein